MEFYSVSMGYEWDVPSGNDCYMVIEIGIFPMKHGDFPQLCKRLPEGNQKHSRLDVMNCDESVRDGCLMAG